MKMAKMYSIAFPTKRLFTAFWCFCFLLWLFPKDAQAQYQRFRFGLGFNPSVTWIKAEGNDLSNDGARFGFGYGLFFDYRFTDNYALATGLFVDHWGGSTRLGGEGDTVNQGFVYKLQYLEIPTAFKLMTNQMGRMTYFGQFGLVHQIRFRGTVSVNDQIDNTNEEDLPLEGGATRYNLLLQVGGGVEIQVAGNTSAIVGIYYRNGFINLLKDDVVGQTFLNAVTFTTGFMF